MAIGPVEYLIIEFPGNQFKGEIVPALADLIDSGTVRLIDAVFMTKDADGNVVWDEYDAGEEGDGFGFAALDGEAGLLNEDDVLLAAESLALNSTAVLLVWEDLWATPFAVAVRNAGGQIIDGARLPHDLVQAAVDSMTS
jgi:Family of unknown function (DUF6325)